VHACVKAVQQCGFDALDCNGLVLRIDAQREIWLENEEILAHSLVLHHVSTLTTDAMLDPLHLDQVAKVPFN
jgi:hypothetical protein